jgi:hypothetical protein
VPGECIWRVIVSLARQSGKRSRSERCQSKFNNRLHLFYRFVVSAFLAPTQSQNPAAGQTKLFVLCPVIKNSNKIEALKKKSPRFESLLTTHCL